MRSWWCFATLLLLPACQPDPTTEVELLPYEGDAFPVRSVPIAYPAFAGLVTDSFSDTISVVDLATGERLASRPVGRNPVDLDGPHHVAVDPEANAVFVALSYPRVNATGPHAVHGSAAVPGYVQRLTLDQLTPVGNVRVANNPGDIVLSGDKKRLVVSHYDLTLAEANPTDVEAARASLAVIDTTQILASGSPRPKMIKTCVAPHSVILPQPDGRMAYVACYGEDALAIVDLDDDSVPIERIDVGPGVVGFGAPSYGPYAMSLSPDGKWIAVSNTESRDVRFFDTTTRTFDLARTITTQGAPYFTTFTANGERLYIPTQGPDAIVVADITGMTAPTLRPLTRDECPVPHLVARSGASIFAVCEGDHVGAGKVAAFDELLNHQRSTDVGVYPDSLFMLGSAP